VLLLLLLALILAVLRLACAGGSASSIMCSSPVSGQTGFFSCINMYIQTQPQNAQICMRQLDHKVSVFSSFAAVLLCNCVNQLSIALVVKQGSRRMSADAHKEEQQCSSKVSKQAR
jgi:hypothetical protein